MSGPPKPTVALVCGAFHQASCMDAFVAQLAALGFDTQCAALVGTDNAAATPTDEIAGIQALLKHAIDGGKEVVLILHSLSGRPGGVAVEGWSVTERQARGLKGGIVGVILLAAILVPETAYLAKATSADPFESWSEEDNATGLLHVRPSAAVHVFYHDCAPDHATALVRQLRGHSVQAMRSSLPASGPAPLLGPAFDGRRAYVFCRQDQCLPLSAQRAMVQGSGVEWMQRDVEASHSPFVSMPDRLAAVVEGIVRDLART